MKMDWHSKAASPDLVGEAASIPTTPRGAVLEGGLESMPVDDGAPLGAAAPFPKPVTFERDTARPLARSDLCLIDFPGEPRLETFGGTPPSGHETMQVITTLLNDKFGIERVASGVLESGTGDIRYRHDLN